MELTEEVLATTLKHLSMKRANFYLSATNSPPDSREKERFQAEYERLNTAVYYFEEVQAARIEVA